MKILWLCNIILPMFSIVEGRSSNNAGGWLTGIYDALPKKELEIIFCFPDTKEKQVRYLCTDTAKGYAFPARKREYQYDDKLQEDFEKILDKERPDLVHIWGTEFPHSLSMSLACEHYCLGQRTVVSIQGLCSIYTGHYNTGLPSNILYGATFRDIVRLDNIYLQKKKFAKRGKWEELMLQHCYHVIGRTDWDEATTYWINPKRNYYFCNEVLRTPFYSGRWAYDKCVQHTMFVCQSYYPIKGLHILLRAVAMLKREYSDIKVITTGEDYIHDFSVKRKIHLSNYQKYIIYLVKKYDLYENIQFAGNLSALGMKEKLLEANVFVLPSLIENSPNSLGEAMLLGVPSIVSDVGGVKNMIVHGKEGYVYPVDEPYMLAYYIKKVFDDQGALNTMTEHAREHAGKTHSGLENAKKLLDIYNHVKNYE